MTHFNPKEQFVKYHKDDFTRLREEHQQPWFLTSTSFALLDVVSRGASLEQVDGIKLFIQSMNNLAAEEETVTTFPKQRLVTYDKSIEELTK